MSAVDNIDIVKENISMAAKKVNKEADDIKLVAVSKTVPLDAIKSVFEKGQLIFGENYVQEFIKKQELIPEINWHFIGQLQSNKVKYIVNKISMLHSLDRQSLAKKIGKRYNEQNLTLDTLIQVNVGEEPQKGGIEPSRLFEFMDNVMETGSINVVGLMCIHPYREPEECREYFVKMRNLYEKAIGRGYPIKHLSMGMSSDYVQAIEEGSTIVRVGSAIFGHRK